jgi:hypothetical protein
MNPSVSNNQKAAYSALLKTVGLGIAVYGSTLVYSYFHPKMTLKKEENKYELTTKLPIASTPCGCGDGINYDYNKIELVLAGQELTRDDSLLMQNKNIGFFQFMSDSTRIVRTYYNTDENLGFVRDTIDLSQ